MPYPYPTKQERYDAIAGYVPPEVFPSRMFENALPLTGGLNGATGPLGLVTGGGEPKPDNDGDKPEQPPPVPPQDPSPLPQDDD